MAAREQALRALRSGARGRGAGAIAIIPTPGFASPCGVSQPGWFGSFQIPHHETRGSTLPAVVLVAVGAAVAAARRADELAERASRSAGTWRCAALTRVLLCAQRGPCAGRVEVDGDAARRPRSTHEVVVADPKLAAGSRAGFAPLNPRGLRRAVVPGAIAFHSIVTRTASTPSPRHPVERVLALARRCRRRAGCRPASPRPCRGPRARSRAARGSAMAAAQASRSVLQGDGGASAIEQGPAAAGCGAFRAAVRNGSPLG